MKQQVVDNVHEIKVKINRVEHEMIRACQVLEQCLKGFEATTAWTSDDLTKEFVKWQVMHGESIQQMFEDQFATIEQRLAAIEKVVGELKGL